VKVGFLGLCAFASLMLIASPATATIVDVTYTGEVTGHSADARAIFPNIYLGRLLEWPRQRRTSQ
jgi:hypothetical protein